VYSLFQACPEKSRLFSSFTEMAEKRQPAQNFSHIFFHPRGAVSSQSTAVTGSIVSCSAKMVSLPPANSLINTENVLTRLIRATLSGGAVLIGH